MAEVQLHAGTAGATADAHILAAWERRKAAHREFESMPAEARSDDGATSPDEARLWVTIKDAEATIAEARPVTLAGIEAQLWTGLEGVINSPEARESDALLHGNLEALEAIGSQLDWEVRAILSAIRALRNLGEA